MALNIPQMHHAVRLYEKMRLIAVDEARELAQWLLDCMRGPSSRVSNLKLNGMHRRHANRRISTDKQTATKSEPAPNHAHTHTITHEQSQVSKDTNNANRINMLIWSTLRRTSLNKSGLKPLAS